MKRVVFEPVKSSQIKKVGYVAEDRTLYVEFNNKRLYSYSPVTQEQYNEFKNSESIGKYFHKNLKMNSTLKIRPVTPDPNKM